LLAYFRKLTGEIKRVTVVHGEEDQSLSFAEALRQEAPGADVIVPELGQGIDF